MPAFSPSLSEQTNTPSLQELGISKQPRNNFQHFVQPRLQRTKPIIWCAAILCFIFSILLIFFGIGTLIFYLSLKPKHPLFDIPNASLNLVYFDSPNYFNGEFTLLTNFSNPNKRVKVRFESLDIELFYSGRLISSQKIKPFTQKPKEIRLQPVNLISSLVFLPQDFGVKFQSNRVNYNAKGTFKVRFNMGFLHLSYWLHSSCQIEMTSPPAGVLVSRQCITIR